MARMSSIRAWASAGSMVLGAAYSAMTSQRPGVCGQPLVQIDGGGVIGQVGVVDTVADNALALGPLATQTGILAQAVGELLRLGDEHGQRLAVAQVERGGRLGHGGVGGFVFGVRGLFLGILTGRSLKRCGGVVERGPNLNSRLLVIGHDGDGALGLGVECTGQQSVAGERGDRRRSELGRAKRSYRRPASWRRA